MQRLHVLKPTSSKLTCVYHVNPFFVVEVLGTDIRNGAPFTKQNLYCCRMRSFAIYKNIYVFRWHYLTGIFEPFCRVANVRTEQFRQRANYSSRSTNQRSFKNAFYICILLRSPGEWMDDRCSVRLIIYFINSRDKYGTGVDGKVGPSNS